MLIDLSEWINAENGGSFLQIHSQLGNTYFLSSDTELSGSPPRRLPPQIHVNQSTNHTSSSSENIAISRDDHVLKHTATTSTPLKPVENVNFYSLGLPILNTGINCSILFPCDF